MGIISWIVLGLVVGILAQFILQGKDPGGLIFTCILGIVGAFVGGFIGSLLKLGTTNDFSIKTVALAVVGALLVLIVYRKVA